GVSGNNIYFGVDQTWYTGSSWARPILNAGGTAVSSSPGGTNIFVYFGSNYITFDNFEMTGAYWPANPTYGSNAFFNMGSSKNVDVKNCYMHGWTDQQTGGRDWGAGFLGDTHTPNG